MKDHEDIIDKVAEETGYDIKLVAYVVNNFWKTLRWYLSNPLETKFGIIIEKFIKIEIPLMRVLTRVQTLNRQKRYYSRFNELVRLIKQLKEFEKKWRKTNQPQK